MHGMKVVKNILTFGMYNQKCKHGCIKIQNIF